VYILLIIFMSVISILAYCCLLSICFVWIYCRMYCTVHIWAAYSVLNDDDCASDSLYISIVGLLLDCV